jgi:hypothetical protein
VSRRNARARHVFGAVAIALFAGALWSSLAGAMASDGRHHGFCRSGRPPASFGREFAPRGRWFDVHLLAEGRKVEAGQWPRFRIVNSGTRDVTYGVSVRIQRWAHGTWTRMPLPKDVALAPILYRLSPETVSGCTGPLTFGDWPAGQYRWLLSVGASDGHGHGRHRVLHAPFRLTARPRPATCLFFSLPEDQEAGRKSDCHATDDQAEFLHR